MPVTAPAKVERDLKVGGIPSFAKRVAPIPSDTDRLAGSPVRLETDAMIVGHRGGAHAELGRGAVSLRPDETLAVLPTSTGHILGRTVLRVFSPAGAQTGIYRMHYEAERGRHDTALVSLDPLVDLADLFLDKNKGVAYRLMERYERDQNALLLSYHACMDLGISSMSVSLWRDPSVMSLPEIMRKGALQAQLPQQVRSPDGLEDIFPRR